MMIIKLENKMYQHERWSSHLKWLHRFILTDIPSKWHQSLDQNRLRGHLMPITLCDLVAFNDE